MTLELLTFILYALIVISWCVTLFGITQFRVLSHPLKVFVVIRILSSLADLSGLVLVKVFTKNPNAAGIIYTILATSLFFLFFYLSIKKEKLKYPFILAASFLSGFMIMNWGFIQKTENNSYSYALHSIVILTLGLIYFYSLMKDLPNSNLLGSSLFWIMGGIVIYGAGGLFMWIMTDYLVHVVGDNLVGYWSFHNILAITSNIFFFVGIWLGAKEGKMRGQELVDKNRIR